MSLECIYQISVAWWDPLKLQQADCGNVRIALPPSILLRDIVLPESGNRTFVMLYSAGNISSFSCVCVCVCQLIDKEDNIS